MWQLARALSGLPHDPALILSAFPDVPTNGGSSLDTVHLLAWLQAQPKPLQNAVTRAAPDGPNPLQPAAVAGDLTPGVTALPLVPGPDYDTDVANAHRLALQHGQDLRYCSAWACWLVWDGQRWAKDETGAVERRAMDTTRNIYHEAADEPDKNRAAALGKWARASRFGSRIREMIRLAQALLPVRADALDGDPWLLCCGNGVLDLRTGELRPHRRGDLITKLAPASYNPTATAPTWAAFLDRIMGGNLELVDFLARAAGYSLTGDVSERVLFFLYGTGANGKTTMLETLRAALGDYALRTPAETLLAKPPGGIPNDVARLRGARLVTASETEDGRRLAEALVKDLTGGDAISARFMRGEFFDFRPSCKMWLATNHRPMVRGTDAGIWDRIRLIPFTVRIPEAEQDKHLVDRLKEELPGVLAWAVRGCLAWQHEGLRIPPAVREATAAYQTDMDVVGAFLDDCCVASAGAVVPSGELYAAYKKWCTDNGERELTQRALAVHLAERGFRPDKERHRRVWWGVGLADEYQQTDAMDALA